MINWGNIPVGTVIPFPFAAFGADGESLTLTGLATTDIEVYKGTSMTQRASDAGFALMDTDGIDIDARTGIHGFSIDTGDNTTAGFYSAGDLFWVVVDAVTINAQTVRFVAGTFRLVAAETVVGVPKVDQQAWGGSTTPVTMFTRWIGSTAFLFGTADSGTTTTMVDAALTQTDTDYWKGNIIVFHNGTIIGQSRLITAFDPATDTITFAPPTTQAVSTNNYAIIPLGLGKLYDDLVATLADTAEIGTAGAGLTNINLPNQTMDIVGNITGNLSGSVGSVTGAVGSVTGAVGSVTGNVGGNVVGSVASVTGAINTAAGVITTLDGLDTAQDTQHATTQSALTTIDGIVDNILLDTAELQTDWVDGGRLDLILDARASQTSVDDLPTNAELATALGTADDAVLAAIAALENLSAADVNAQVVDALNVDTYAEPTGVPAATASIVEKLGRLHMALRNQITVDADNKNFHDDAGNVEWKKPLSDDGTTYTEAEAAAP